MKDLSGYLIVGGVAAVVTAIMTPIVAFYARKLGWMATPDERRNHPEATPDVGGIAFFVALVAAIFTAWQMDRFDPLFKNNSELVGVSIAGLVVFILGFIDDIHEVSAPMKVTGVVVAAIALVWFGVTMIYFRAPFVDVFVLSFCFFGLRPGKASDKETYRISQKSKPKCAKIIVKPSGTNSTHSRLRTAKTATATRPIRNK